MHKWQENLKTKRVSNYSDVQGEIWRSGLTSVLAILQAKVDSKSILELVEQ